MTIEIIVDNSCTGCGRCRVICPKGPRVWQIKNQTDGSLVFFAKDPSSCLFCKKCVGACPVKAITVRNRAKIQP